MFAVLLYLRTLAPGVLGGDSGEFQFAAWLGGFAHPTGYPLYLLLGWLWTHLLPLHDPAWRMNVFSALWGGVATGLVYLLALRMLRQATANPWSRLLALFAALTFAVTPTFWSQATLAEVYTLNAALVAAILLGLVTWGQTGSRRALYVAALLYGLSLAHHRTTLLYLPAIAIFVWLAIRQRATSSRVPRPASPCHLVAPSPCHPVAPRPGAAAPLSDHPAAPRRTCPTSRFVSAADQVLQLYRPTLAGFIEHISGQGFGSALGVGGSAAARLKGLPALFAAELTVVGLALGLLGLIGLAVRAKPLLALTGLSFLAIVGFNLVYGIGDIYGYYIPAYLIWVLWMALGLGAVCDAVRGRRGDTETRRHGDAESIPAQHSPRRRVAASPRHWLALALCLVALALPIYLLITNFASHDRSQDVTAQAWDALLAQPIPQDAILVTNDRDEMMPQWYLKYVEGRRADLTGLFPLIQPGPEWADVGAVTDQALRSGRPVYLIKPMAGLEVKFNLAPEGALVRVDWPGRGRPARAGGGANVRRRDPAGGLRCGAGCAQTRRRRGDHAALAADHAPRRGLHDLRPPDQRQRGQDRAKRPSAGRRLLPHIPVEAGRDVDRQTHAGPAGRPGAGAVHDDRWPVRQRRRDAALWASRSRSALWAGRISVSFRFACVVSSCAILMTLRVKTSPCQEAFEVFLRLS